MTVYEMAQKYYPRLWDAARIEALVTAGRLTREEADRIMGEAATNE
ncbi:MAG: XkdX family protein [Pseudoflavonifractor sp.]|nr:XkdX family protein [Pseudoflavonifractor sp.]